MAEYSRPATLEDLKTLAICCSRQTAARENARNEHCSCLLPFEVRIDLDGLIIRTVSLEGLLKTKQTYREKDALDRKVIEHALQGKSGPDPDS